MSEKYPEYCKLMVFSKINRFCTKSTQYGKEEIPRGNGTTAGARPAEQRIAECHLPNTDQDSNGEQT